MPASSQRPGRISSRSLIAQRNAPGNKCSSLFRIAQSGRLSCAARVVAAYFPRFFALKERRFSATDLQVPFLFPTPAAKAWAGRQLGAALLPLLLAACAREPYGAADARAPAEAMQPLPAGLDSVHHAAAGRHYSQHGRLYQAAFGRHYRAVWAAPVTAPVFNLASAGPGGQPLAPLKAGGGYQSISLSLQAPDGREFALRALDKDPRKTLPSWLRRTFLLNAVRDATSATNPYGALVVPPLAEAVGVVPTHPRLVYVRPDEAGLGELSARFRGRLALLEEKYNGLSDRPAALAQAQALLGGEDMLRQLYAGPRQRIDQPAFLRARLLDVWLGDWDRHERQWQWAAFPEPDGATRFQALPKDRDQVFFRFDDGLLPWLVSRPFIVAKLQTFRARYDNVPGLVKQAHFIDQRGLMALTRADFQRAAAQLQTQLSDPLIGRALRRLPPAVYALVGPATEAALRARRAALPAAADKFYLALAREPTVAGTAQAEHFVVRRWADSVQVSVFAPSLGRDSVRFQRMFFASETSRITLEGLGGADDFWLESLASAGWPARIRLVLVGGAGADRARGVGPARYVVYYDEDQDKPPPATSSKVGFWLRPRRLPRHYRPYDRLNDD